MPKKRGQKFNHFNKRPPRNDDFVPPGTNLRTIQDLTREEIAELERRYGMPVRPRAKPLSRPATVDLDPELDSVDDEI